MISDATFRSSPLLMTAEKCGLLIREDEGRRKMEDVPKESLWEKITEERRKKERILVIGWFFNDETQLFRMIPDNKVGIEFQQFDIDQQITKAADRKKQSKSLYPGNTCY